EVNARPLRFISDMMLDDSWSHMLMGTLAPRGYVKVASVRMQGLLLLLFTKQTHVPFIRDVRTTYTRTGIFGYWPSYKFDRNGDTYDTSGKKRKPAWTDRILWRVKPQFPPPEDDDENASTQMDDGQEEYPIHVHQDDYTSVMSYGVSDHKPVLASFRLELRKRRDTALVHVSAEGPWSADADAHAELHGCKRTSCPPPGTGSLFI
ncbi:hypothetical protein CRUP_037556, partial [Coryphaenoides rupestris]